ncbi:MAG: hypothetical protein ACE5LG_06355 [Anaerolineae bacterium]
MAKDNKRELLLALRPRYLKAGQAQEGHILDQFMAATGYHRQYAIHLPARAGVAPCGGGRHRKMARP